MIRVTILAYLLSAVIISIPAAAHAAPDAASPVGYWKTIDDEEGTEKSVVQIWEKDGQMFGKIIQLFEDPKATCDECKGELKGKPVVGMQILSGLKKDDDEWSGGTIMDPANGKTYKCYIEVQDGGKKLKVRGYIGISLFGRTQYWYRVEQPTT